MERPYDKEYGEYRARISAALGDVQEGEYRKHKGRLVKVLTYDEFFERFDRFVELRRTYDETLRYGDTVNDALASLLADDAAALLIDL